MKKRVLLALLACLALSTACDKAKPDGENVAPPAGNPQPPAPPADPLAASIEASKKTLAAAAGTHWSVNQVTEGKKPTDLTPEGMKEISYEFKNAKEGFLHYQAPGEIVDGSPVRISAPLQLSVNPKTAAIEAKVDAKAITCLDSKGKPLADPNECERIKADHGIDLHLGGFTCHFTSTNDGHGLILKGIVPELFVQKKDTAGSMTLHRIKTRMGHWIASSASFADGTHADIDSDPSLSTSHVFSFLSKTLGKYKKMLPKEFPGSLAVETFDSFHSPEEKVTFSALFFFAPEFPRYCSISTTFQIKAADHTAKTTAPVSLMGAFDAEPVFTCTCNTGAAVHCPQRLVDETKAELEHLAFNGLVSIDVESDTLKISGKKTPTINGTPAETVVFSRYFE